MSFFRTGQDGRELYSQAPCNFARRRRCPDSQAASWETLEACSSECSSITVTLGSSAQIAWGAAKGNFGPTLTHHPTSRPGEFLLIRINRKRFPTGIVQEGKRAPHGAGASPWRKGAKNRPLHFLKHDQYPAQRGRGPTDRQIQRRGRGAFPGTVAADFRDAGTGPGRDPAPGDITGQAELAWGHIVKMLEQAGMTVHDLVKVTHTLIRPEDIPGYVKVRSRFLGDARPASMLLIVPQLVRPEFLIEIEAIAAKADG